ncbi:MAG: hypothetical protein E7337_13515 [Clostridiales bacterium]|nr:hypothetical protein [Clostridiales bacterium]
MSKNTTATPVATATVPATTLPKNQKEEKTMKNTTAKTTKTTPATSAPMTAQEFKQKSYDAYLSYVAFIEGNKSIDETLSDLSPLMTAYGFALTIDNLANTLTVKMTAYGKDKGEQAKKVKSIATFRAFVKGGWAEVAAAPVHSNAGKNPAESVSKAKAKGPTKADLEAELAAVRAQLAALTNPQSAPATSEGSTTEAPNTEAKAA